MKDLPNINEYVKHLNSNNYGNSTLVAYLTGLNHFKKYLTIKNIKNFNEINIEVINQFIQELSISNNTANVYINGVKNYFNFLEKYKSLNFNFKIEDIKEIKRSKVVNKEIDYELMTRRLNVIKKNDSLSSKRDYIIIQLVIKTGIRISDLIKIRVDQFSDDSIKINDYFYYIDRELSKDINDYLSRLDHKFAYLFVSFSRNIKLNGDQCLTSSSVARMIKKNFGNISYNGLKSIYFKNIIDDLPEIETTHCHNIGGKTMIDDLYKIINNEDEKYSN
ncbi:MAG: site-specific integrase [Patescibacteria group bacterium]